MMPPFDYEAAAQERNRRAKMRRDAAPDLLAALDTLVWQLDRMDGLPDELERMVADAKAAITKARGA